MTSPNRCIIVMVSEASDICRTPLKKAEYQKIRCPPNACFLAKRKASEINRKTQATAAGLRKPPDSARRTASSGPTDTIMPTNIPVITSGMNASNANRLWFGGALDGTPIDEVPDRIRGDCIGSRRLKAEIANDMAKRTEMVFGKRCLLVLSIFLMMMFFGACVFLVWVMFQWLQFT